MENEQIKISFFKNIADDFISLFSETKRKEKIEKTKHYNNVNDVNEQVNDLIDVNALVTVFELVKEGYKLSGYQKKIFDEKIEKLYLSTDEYSVKKIKNLMGVGHKPSDFFILNVLMDVSSPYFKERVSFFANNLFKEKLNDKIFSQIRTDKIVFLAENAVKKIKLEYETSKQNHFSLEVQHVPSEKMVINIHEYYFKTEYEHIKDELSVNDLIKIINHLQVYKDYLITMKGLNNTGEIDLIIKDLGKKLDTDFNNKVELLIEENIKEYKEEKDLEKNENEINELLASIDSSLQMVVKYKETILYKSKDRIENIEKKMKYIQPKEITEVSKIEKELRDYKVRIQIEKVRALSVMENYSNTLNTFI